MGMEGPQKTTAVNSHQDACSGGKLHSPAQVSTSEGHGCPEFNPVCLIIYVLKALGREGTREKAISKGGGITGSGGIRERGGIREGGTREGICRLDSPPQVSVEAPPQWAGRRHREPLGSPSRSTQGLSTLLQGPEVLQQAPNSVSGPFPRTAKCLFTFQLFLHFMGVSKVCVFVLAQRMPCKHRPGQADRVICRQCQALSQCLGRAVPTGAAGRSGREGQADVTTVRTCPVPCWVDSDTHPGSLTWPGLQRAAIRGHGGPRVHPLPNSWDLRMLSSAGTVSAA